jgi:tripartite-type tricarboxylate transporter receptor subunit TctC
MAGMPAASLISAAYLALLPLASAQSYPTKPIRFIVASAPGGAPDILARTVAQKLAESLGQQVVVDNRAGASGLVGAELAAKSPPDGHTIFLATTTLYAILPNLRTKLPYDPVKDFISITQIASASNVLVINASVPARSVSELIQLGRSKPASLNYASAGNGTPAHLAGEMLNLMANLTMTHVPYKGAGPALIDVIAGQVQLMVTSPIAAGPHITSGKVRALATTGEKRSPVLPDLPTVNETLPGYIVTQWWGISVPAKTPAAIVTKLHAETVKALSLPEVRERLNRDGAVAVGGSAKDFDELIAAERARFGKVIKQAKIHLEG